MAGRNRPVLARAAAALWLAALMPHAGLAAESTLHSLPLRSLSASGPSRTLDWRGPEAKATFSLPPGTEAEHVRIVLSATPGDPAPAEGRIEVRLNGSPPAVVRPEAFPFTAQLDFPGAWARPGANEATILFRPAEAPCLTARDGAWSIDLSMSRIELSAPDARPETLGQLDMVLRSELLSPRRIALLAPEDATPDEAAAFQAWAAIAVGLRVRRTPRFTTEAGPAELTLRWARDPEAESARISLAPQGPLTATIHAASADAATDFLRNLAEAAASARSFAAPAFDAGWRPEAQEAAFLLTARPSGARLRIGWSRGGAEGGESQLRLTLNGRPLPTAALAARTGEVLIAAPAHLLQPGLNTITLRPDIAPGVADDACATGEAPRFMLRKLRLERDDDRTADALFAFAGGDFGDGPADLFLPAASRAERAAQLRLLAELARRSGSVPELGRIVTAPPQGTETAAIAARALVPEAWLAAAPPSLQAALRPARERFRYGSRAVAADLEFGVTGAAARYPLPDGGALTLVTEADGAAFAASIDHLVDSGMLSAFDGRVVRWTPDGPFVQDRGPWTPPPMRIPPPATLQELERTLLFLLKLGGLGLGGYLAGRRR